MSILNSQKLKTRILMGYTVPLGLLLLFGIIMGATVKMNNDTREDLARANEVISNLRETSISTARIVRSARGAILFPNNPSYPTAVNEGIEKIGIHAPLAEELIKDPEILTEWTEYEEHLNDLIPQVEQVMQLVQSNRIPEATALMANLDMTQMDQEEVDVIEMEEEVIAGLNGRAETIGNITMLVVVFGILGGGAATLIFANMIAQAITGDVKKAITNISSSSSEIAATMEQQERTASLQAASVNETTTTMDELRASSHQSEEQAEAAAQASQEVLQLADNGNQSVEETVSTMIDLKNKVAAIADQIVRLSEQTNQIGNISALVSDLSQQTNMLALNASVEAVRAGEHGKGFAVVAEEIRKLADQSRQSAANIGNLVSDIQNAINTTVMVTDEGTKTVNAGMSITERTANAFAGVLESINNVAMNNQQIVLNLRQQGKAVQQVLEAMDNINKGSQETASGLSQVKAGTKQLSTTARELEAIV